MSEKLRGPEKKKGQVSPREAAAMEDALFRREQEEKAERRARQGAEEGSIEGEGSPRR